MMNDIYVHTLRYHYFGRENRQSRTMFPVSYGPFKDEDSAREWIRQRGITRATKIMYSPAKENLKVTPGPIPDEKIRRHASVLQGQTHHGSLP